MVTTKVFLSNTTQAVRLPRAVAFPDDVSEVEIIAMGSARVVLPVGRRWDWFFTDVVAVTDDFMADRPQPAPQEREAW